jgi:hypothetical protein
MAEPQIQEIRQSQTTIPEYARHYVEDLLGIGAGTIYNYKMKDGKPVLDSQGMPVIEGFKPFMQYTGDRFAQFTPLQQQAFEAAGQLRVPGQMYDASQIAKLAAERAGNIQYTPYDYKAAQVNVDPRQFNMQGMTSAQSAYTPKLEAYQMDPAQAVAAREYTAPSMRTAQTSYNPQLQQYQMGPAKEVQTQRFTAPGVAESYMSPYVQNVMDIEKREAQRQADIAAKRLRSAATKAGAFGGGRHAIESAELQRNLATQMGDIQSRGLQAAYDRAGQLYTTDVGRELEAAKANQMAGMNVGQQNLQALLSTQQLGTQTGLQAALANLSSEQQANVQNLAAQLQTQGLNADQAIRAALANQQANLTVGQQNLASKLGTQQTSAQYGTQMALANLNNEQQARIQNMATQLQLTGMSSDQALRAALANQQAYQNAANLSEQSRQYGAGLGLQGLQAAMQGAGQLGNLGQNIYGQYTGNINLQNQLGNQQQNQVQNMLNANYQDFLNAQNHPYKQLGFMSDLLRGTQGLGQTSMYSYQAPPSATNQLLGMAGTAATLGRMGGYFKEGGTVGAGLADLAISQMA